MRKSWDDDLNLLCSDMPPHERAIIAERLEKHIASVERQRDDHFAEITRARSLLTGHMLYRERLLTCIFESTKAMRARMKELAIPPRDDFDRAVLHTVADFEKVLDLIRSDASDPTSSQDQGEKK